MKNQKNQMQCLAMHLGRWEGIFADFSPDARFLSQKESVILFEEPEPNMIRQTNRYPGCEDKVWEYQDLSRSLQFFEDGSFSNGRVQLAPFSAFAAEQGFLHGDYKARMVHLFDTDGKASAITTIQEVRGSYQEPASIHNPLESLLGIWRGEALVLFPDWPEPEKFESELILEKVGGQVRRQSKIGMHTVDWSGTVEDESVNFDSYRMVFYPGNLLAISPWQLPLFSSDKSFFVETGWFIEPRLCLRMIRHYDPKGAWQRTMLIKEQKL
jgi:Domain of unknown function (DUF3598)